MDKWKQRRESVARRFSRAGSIKESPEITVIQLKFRLRDFQPDPEAPEGEGQSGMEEEMKKLTNDFYLYQWLKIHNFNVEKTESALKKSFTWRKKNGISSSTPLPPEEAKLFPVYMDAISRAGAPVGSFGKLPAWDVRKFIDGSPDGGERFVRYCGLMTLAAENVWLKHNTSLGKKFNDPAENVTFICTPVGLSPTQAGSTKVVRSTIQLLNNVANYFPPVIEQIIFVNVPRTFSIIFKLLKPFLSFIKIEFYDRDENKWKKSLSQFIDLGQLRPQFGGTKSP